MVKKRGLVPENKDKDIEENLDPEQLHELNMTKVFGFNRKDRDVADLSFNMMLYLMSYVHRLEIMINRTNLIDRERERIFMEEIGKMPAFEKDKMDNRLRGLNMKLNAECDRQEMQTRSAVMNEVNGLLRNWTKIRGANIDELPKFPPFDEISKTRTEELNVMINQTSSVLSQTLFSTYQNISAVYDGFVKNK